MGPEGPPGPQGPPGTSGGALYEQNFTNAGVVSVPHGLGYTPSIRVVLQSGELVEADVFHDDDDNATVSFSSPQTGKVVAS